MPGLSPAGRAPWGGFVQPPLAAQADEVARTVAARLRNRTRLLEINSRALAQSRYPDTLHWQPCALAHGDAGLALACGHFDRCWPGEGWDEAAAGYLQTALRAARSMPPGGMFSGTAGVGYAATSLGEPDTEGLGHELARHALALCAGLHGRHGAAVSQFDLISGLAGLGVGFLAAGLAPPTDVALHAILDTFVGLSGTEAGLPHWFTPRHLLGDNPMAQAMPHGNLNVGLAHGIPGPLALMALTCEAGAEVEGLREAMARTAETLVRHQVRDAHGVNWPTVVPLDAAGHAVAGAHGSRCAWCYGAPGVARSLWLAGRALGQAAWQELAIEAMAAVYRRPLALRQIDSPTFCHGVAGLLQVTLRFAQDTGLPVFREAADALCRQLLAAFDADSALGYRSIEPEGNRVDQCGLLDGAAGVALVLLAVARPVAPDWDRAFLLS